jgi:capsular exopolysaccharide synthesis family protein
MDWTSIWEIVRRRKWVIIQATLIVGAVAYLGSYLMVPSYETGSKILIKRHKQSAVDIGTETIGLPGLSSMIIRTHADISVNRILAASRPYLGEIISKLQLRDATGSLISPGKLVQAGVMSQIRGKVFPQPSVRITQFQEASILEVKASSDDPKEAMMMANGLAEIMVVQNQNLMTQEYKTAREFLEVQMKKIKRRYTEALLEFTDFKKKEKTIDLQVETKLTAEKMSELLRQKEDDVIQLAQSRGKLTSLENQLARLSPENLPADTLSESPQIEMLKKRLMGFNLEFAVAASELTEKHPRIHVLKEQIALAEQELEKEIRVYQKTAPQLMALKRQIAAIEAHLKGTNVQLETYADTLGGLPDKALGRETLGLEFNVTNQTYKSLLESLYQIGMAEASTLSEIRLMERAVEPSSPASPDVKLNGILGAFLGLCFGFGMALIMEYLDDTVRKTDDVRQFRPITLLGTIPVIDEKTVPLISAKDPNDPVYESYRKIRNSFVTDGKQVKAVIVTSPGPGEGKSITVANLGISVAREGKNVAILDMDLRRASLHKVFDLPNEAGVTDLLQGKISLKEAIRPTRVEGLSIITSGLPFPDPGRLIESKAMGKVLSALRARFDFVILDSAPVLVKSDALVLEKYTDGSIIALESERTTQRAVHALLELLARAHIRPLGFVLNGTSLQKGKYYYQQYYSGHHVGGLSAGANIP